MRKDRLYLITGHNRVGKSTIARLVHEAEEARGNCPSRILPFGEGLRDELEDMGIPRSYLFEKSPRARRLMRAYGDARREIDPLHFVNIWQEEANRWAWGASDTWERMTLIADDVYHLNELLGALQTAEALQMEPVIIIVRKEGLSPTDEDLALYDSVRETAQILDFFDYIPDKTTQELTASEVLQGNKYLFDQSEMDLILTATVQFVYNDSETLEEYERLLNKVILGAHS